MEGFLVKVYPVLRDDARLEISEDFVIASDYLMVVSEGISKYSFCTKVVEREKSDTPKLYVDSHRSGPIEEGEEVMVYPIQVPNARNVTILIEESVRVPEGDWGKVLADSIEGQLVDAGSELGVVYPSKLNPFFVNTIVKTGIPTPPFVLTSETQVFVEKLPKEYMIKEQQKHYSYAVKRAEDYIQRGENNQVFFFSKLKAGNLPQKQMNFKFKADPRTIGGILRSIFHGYAEVDRVEEFIGENFIGTYAWLSSDSVYIDARVFSNDDLGQIQFEVYAEKLPSEKFIDNLTNQLKQAIATIELTPKLIDRDCRGCGASLILEEIQSNGLVKCLACNEYNAIPVSLRIS